MKYIVLMDQNGGCDYTIGCGKNWYTITADNITHAMEKVFGKVTADGSIDEDDDYIRLGEDGSANHVQILPLGTGESAHWEMTQAYYDSLQEAEQTYENKQKELQKEANEKKEFERLQKKFGKK